MIKQYSAGCSGSLLTKPLNGVSSCGAHQILPRRNAKVLQRSVGFSAARGRQIVVWLAVADLMASAGKSCCYAKLTNSFETPWLNC